MALYKLEDFKKIISESEVETFNARRVNKNLDKLGWELLNLEKVLLSLELKDFQKPAPNCKIDDRYERNLIDADQYEIHWNEEENCRSPQMNSKTISLSIKIAIMTNDNGSLAGAVTFHLSGSVG